MQFIECYVPSMYFHYDGAFAFAPPVRRDYGEGTFPSCIPNMLVPRGNDGVPVTFALFVTQ
eukprot:1512751-Ditylum_brightwellii.AAC.1